MRRKKNDLYKILILLLLGIGLGYALLTQDLTINGITKVRGNEWDIHFDNVQISQGSVSLSTGDSAAEIDSNDDTLVNYTVTLNLPGDYYEFTVDAVNEGTVDGMIGTITSKYNNVAISNENPLPSYLDYSVTYDDDIEIEDNHILAAGTSETYKVHLEFKRDIENSELPSTDQTNTFSFGVEYLQKDGTAIPRPKYPTIQSPSTYYDDDSGEYYPISALLSEASYYEKIKTITLGEEINPPENVIDSWDVSVRQNGDVMAYITVNQNDNTMYDLTVQGNGALYANPDSSYLFASLVNLDAINNIEALNTSNVTNMCRMFYLTGFSSTIFTLNLGNSFDTSNVTDMTGMFADTGGTIFTLNLGDQFDTSNVTNMSDMFSETGYSSPVFTLDLGSKFDTSNVTNMYNMFNSSGYSSTVFTLDLGSKFDTSNVVDMTGMFEAVGYSSSAFTLSLGDKFDTSNITNMMCMFARTGYSSTTFTLDLGDKFDTSNVTNMCAMFSYAGYSNPNFTLNLGNKFDTSNVTDMASMFQYTGYANATLELDLSTFDFSMVTSYNGIFNGWGSTNKIWVKDATARTWVIARESNLTTSNVLIKT